MREWLEDFAALAFLCVAFGAVLVIMGALAS